MDGREAQAALAGIGAGQARLAAAMACPPWRHAAFGGVMALLVGAAGMPVPWQLATVVVALGAIAALAAHDRRRMGVFVNGYRRGATRVVALAALGAMLALIVAELHLRESGGSVAGRIAIAAIAAGLATVASVAWQRVYVRALTREHA